MQVIKQNQLNQSNYVRKRLRQTKLLLRRITKQLEKLSPDKDEQTIKLKLRQSDELNKQRIALERLLEKEVSND